MVCKFCGNTIEDNSEFCFICGNKVAKEESNDAEEVFSQAKPVEVPVIPASAPADAPVVETQPIYAQQAPVYAQQVPVYAQQAYVQQTGTAPAPVAAAPVAPAGKKDKSVCSKAAKFFAALFAATFILQFIPWIWYKNAKKNGYEEKATSILNSLMVGLCIFMAVICVILAKKFMMG
ncbi:MAG: hypothetical protein PUC33_05915 [Oscillospiraceae bacterium]|nr:hypothetical protein [Oscillospiraceae bacterium]MDD6147262.1 hypothetical protein [Oscillospiraceae bacterium]